MEYGIIDRVMQPGNAVAVSFGVWSGGERRGGSGSGSGTAGAGACLPPLPARPVLTHAATPHLLQIERRDYEGQLRASQSQGRGARSGGGAMAGADA